VPAEVRDGGFGNRDDLPRWQSIGCPSGDVRRLVHAAAKESFEVARSADLVECPKYCCNDATVASMPIHPASTA